MLTEAQFEQVFPFHLSLDGDLRIRRMGPGLASLCGPVAPGARLLDLFEVKRPEMSGPIESSALLVRLDKLFVLGLRASELQLRGQFLAGGTSETKLIFVGSPWLVHPDQLREFGLKVRDFAIHDPMIDLLQLAQAQQVSFEEVKQLAEKLTRQRAELRAANQKLAHQNAMLVEADGRLRVQEAESRKLALVAARTGNAVVVTDAQGGIEWVNRAFERLTGYSLQEVQGRRPGSFLQGLETDPAVVREIRELLAQGLGFEKELLNYDRSGRAYYVHIEVQAIRDETGKIANYMAIESDVTDRIQNDLRRTVRDTVLRALAGADSLREGFEAALESVGRLLGLQAGFWWEVSAEGRAMTARFSWAGGQRGVAEFVRDYAVSKIPSGEGLPGRVWAANATRIIEDLAADAADPRAKRAVDAGFRYAIALPVPVRGKVAGVIEFFGPRRVVHDPEIGEFMQQLGDQIGLFVSRILAQDELRQQRDFATQVMSLMGQGVVVTGSDRRIDYCNEAFASLIGKLPEALQGRFVLDFMTEAERPKFTRRWWHQVSRVKTTFETRLRRADGSEFVALITSVPRRKHGRLSGHISTIMDLTERRKSEEVLRRAKEAAETASRAKSDFLATMSHEIRTPMNAVLGMTTLLRETPLDPRQVEFVETVRKSSEALLEIIEDILDFSKIESNMLVLDEQSFDLTSMVEGVIELLAPRAHNKSLELAAVIDPEIPRWRNGDHGRLRQVLVNLVSNGIKFTQTGEVVLHVERAGAGTSPERVFFRVTDTGIGIPLDQQEAIFAPFVQVDTTATRRYGGTGLGLTISRRLVRLLGGEMTVKSAPGEGSSFAFSVPLRAGEGVAPTESAGDLAGLRVLLLDGHTAARASLSNLMRPWGIRVEATNRPAIALEHLHTARDDEDPFRIVLIDSRTLGESADMVASRIASEFGASRPKIALLKRADASGPVPTGRGVVDSYLVKPVKSSSLSACLRGLVSEHKPDVGVPAVATGPGTERAENNDLRILVAEDRAINQRFARLMLERLGYRADFVENGREAVEAVRGRDYDVILMDCQMPTMDGYEATREIRRIEAELPEGKRRHVHIVAMTANVVSENRESCLAAGMDGYISKPVRIELVRDLLRTLTPRAPEAKARETPMVDRAAIRATPAASIATLRSQFGEAAAIEMITMFLNDTPDRLAELVRHRDAGRFVELGRVAHILAGSCGIFGLQEMRERSLRLEERSKQSAPGDLTGDLDAVAAGFAAARELLNGQLRELRDSGGSPAR